MVVKKTRKFPISSRNGLRGSWRVPQLTEWAKMNLRAAFNAQRNRNEARILKAHNFRLAKTGLYDQEIRKYDRKMKLHVHWARDDLLAANGLPNKRKQRRKRKENRIS